MGLDRFNPPVPAARADRPAAEDGGSPGRRSADSAGEELAHRFAAALVAGEGHTAQRVTGTALEAGLDVPGIQSRVLAPALRSIGERWQYGELSVGQEHLATAITQEILGRLFSRALQAPPRSRERVVLAAVEGELHVLGLRMAADVLEGAGFDVRYLGADVPLDELLEVCRSVRPAVLGFGVTMPLHLPTLVWELGAVHGLEDAPALVVGGQAVTASVEAGLGLLRAETSEQAVRSVEQALAGRAAAAARPPVLATGPPAAPGRTRPAMLPHTIQADGQAFAEIVASAADAAREAARRAFAMEQLAYHDPLTGLWNRRAFDDRLHELGRPSGGPPGMILMIDVDRFKDINDEVGHEAGDATLRNIATVILRAVRSVDFVARYGGDEFAVLLPGAGQREAVAITERIRGSVGDRSDGPRPTVSIGGAPILGDRRRTLLLADEALYTAKHTGRDRIVLRAAPPPEPSAEPS